MVGQCVFTGIFLVLAVHSGGTAVAAFGTPARVLGSVLHLIMSVDMAAMVWPWWNRVPVVPQLVVFGFGSLWYAVVAGRHLTRRPPAASPCGTWPAVMHSVMMASMVWMVAVMASSPGAASGHDHAALATPVALLGVGLTAGLLVAGVGTVVTLFETRRRRARPGQLLGIAAEAVMSLAMGVACWLMLVS